jgi:hypothetical protein
MTTKKTTKLSKTENIKFVPNECVNFKVDLIHIDGNHSNCRSDNLEWVLVPENEQSDYWEESDGIITYQIDVNHIDGDYANCHVDNLEWILVPINLKRYYTEEKFRTIKIKSNNTFRTIKILDNGNQNSKKTQNRNQKLQTPKLISKDINGSGEKSEVKEKRLKAKENPQPSS